MEMKIHSSYPEFINNEFGIILGIKLVPSGLPKEGPKPLHDSGYPAILMACNLWSAGEGPDRHEWDWYYCHVPEVNARIDKFVREQTLSFNQWYYLDVYNFKGEFDNEHQD